MANNGNAQLMCGNCGGVLEIDPEKPTVVCSYCGSCFSVSDLLNESERLKIERIRRDAPPNVVNTIFGGVVFESIR